MDGKSKVPKITDVARIAGVSPATVSRVLNGSQNVNAGLAAKVGAAAAKLGYVPFSSARALRRQHARVWAAIVSDIENPFFTAVVRGIEDVARQNHHRLVLCNSDEDLEREAGYIDVAIAERMAGVVIAVASTRESSLKPLIDRHLPVVAIDRAAGRYVDAVLVDTEDIGGVLRIAKMSGDVAEFGFLSLISLAVLLSINLGLINLFPVPMLDGGHLAYYAVEAVRGRPLSDGAQEWGLKIGLAMVLSLMLFATWNDLDYLEVGEKLRWLFN
jgi:RIP metalloprotease RseP